MTLSPTAIVLIATIAIGYLAAVSIGTWACYANDKK